MATRRAQPDIVPDETPAPAPKGKSRKAPAPKAVAAPAATGEKKSRTVRGDRNHLARSIDGILRQSDGPATVHDIVVQITYADGTHPSSGAVAACLKRWAEQGYITVTPKPLGFKSFPAKHKNGSLQDFIDKSRETRLTARRAAKAAA